MERGIGSGPDDRTPGIRPRPTLWRRLDALARASFPGGVSAALLLALSAPFDLPGQLQLQPASALACVFFWSLFRPASMPPLLVFALGLLCDLLGLAPVGTAVLTLLLTHGVAVRWRRVLVRTGFVLVWVVFAAVAAGAAALEWALTSLLTWQLLPAAPAVFEALVAAGIYPALSMLFSLAHGSVADPDQA